MHEAIAEFPSDTLYSSKLVSAAAVAKRHLIDLPCIVDPDGDEAKDVLTDTVIFFDTAGSEMYERTEADYVGSKVGPADGSRYNENEAEVVINWVRRLVTWRDGLQAKRELLRNTSIQIACGVPPSEIAVITPYQAQVAHIGGSLREDYPDLIIGTVDGMQGQEREVGRATIGPSLHLTKFHVTQAVVLSLVRSNEAREVGFLAEHRRLNVAMTRAKRQLVCVTVRALTEI